MPRKIKESDTFTGSILVKELNNLWSSMDELTELCKLISERVDVTNKRIDSLVRWNGLCDKDDK